MKFYLEQVTPGYFNYKTKSKSHYQHSNEQKNRGHSRLKKYPY